MPSSSHDRSRIANNRLAVVIVLGSLLAIVTVGWLYRAGLLDSLVPARGPAADALPMYFLVAAILVALVVWSWGRLLSWFE